ncbi:MAG TPA: outer membrane protein assembly factor BamB [Steroidobacteraceae bacterium]|nr:outer membrane protein assembly factor BamB [Steroidobacteraceae bacterium]
MKRLSCFLVAVALLAACSNNKDSDPPAKLVSFPQKLAVERAWSYGFGGKSKRLRLALRVAVADNVAYAAGYDGEIVALSADHGRKLWSVKTKLPLSGGPGVGEGLVVVGATDGTVLALDAQTGKERWRHRVSSEVLAAPQIAKGIVVVRSVDGRLVALASSDAKQRWAADQTVPRLSLRGTASPVIVQDSVIAGFDNGRVVSVDLMSGDVQWDTALSTPKGRTELERLIDIDAPVRVLGNDVFAAGFQGRIAMLARDSGQIWWAHDFSSYRGFNVAGANIFASSSEGVVVAMRRTDGNVQWEQQALRQRALTAPAVDGDVLVIGDYEGYVHWLNAADGSLLARAKTDGERITSAPLVADGLVYVQTDGGKVIAFATKAKS